ncbi:hypothetical protein [Isoptericola nanjingensis]|uniref:hypothetical protein n=1 Tax=Isoptericola nanjingensis TaxID=903413 RepID=UPI003D1F11D9
MTSAARAEYERWNAALTDVLLPEQDEPRPAYLDLESDVLEALGARMEVASDEVVPALAGAVAATLVTTGGVFAWHRERLRAWRGGRRTATNPLVALLATFSLAAERMASGDGMSAQNYYGRLSDLLGFDAGRLGTSYRDVAEPFWASLNLWLTALDGRRGTPTAYSVGLRYVGLAVSQALVREADRKRLERFFTDFGLAPRSELPPAELTPLLGSWINEPQSPATNHLANLWRKPSLQGRVAEVAATLLAEWDGLDTDTEADEPGARGRARLALSITAFPRPQIRLMPQLFLPRPEVSRQVTLHGEQDEAVTVEQVAGGTMSFQDPGLVDAAGLLEGVLSITDELAGSVVRRPRGLVVFRKDDLTGSWVEVQQVLMGDDVALLVSSRLLDGVEAVLREVSRPGWTTDQSTRGIPHAWTLVREVEIFSRPAEEGRLAQDLRSLVPLTSSQLKLAGGLALPGRLRNRWHSGRAPEVRAVSDVGVPFVVRILDLGPPGDPHDDLVVLEEWPDKGTGSVIQDLAELELDDGDYAVELVVGEDVLSRKEIYLRSSDSPDEALWSRVEEVSHGLADPLSVIGAGDTAAAGPVVQGVLLDAGEVGDRAEVSRPPARPWWRAAADQERTRTVALARPAPDSCFYTGRHRFELGTAMYDSKGRPLATTTEGVCTNCDLRKRFSASYWKNRKQFERRQALASGARVEAAALPPSTPRPEGIAEGWDLALDALRFAGGGPFRLLEGIARQIDPSSLFVKEFVATLEALGHIEVRRSPETLAEVSWEICPTSVIDTREERVLAGFWTPGLLEVAEENLADHGRSLTEEAQTLSPDRWSTSATDAEVLEHLGIEDVLVVGRAGIALAAALPPLSSVVAALPRRKAPPHLDVQWFDPARAAWIDVVGVDGPGAYRVGRYASQHLLRTAQDVVDGTLARADVYLVKHAAAAELGGRALLAYDEHNRELAVPLGASLPGMYQRAVVMDSCRAPERRRSYLVYPGVTPEVAHRITHLLQN